MEIFRRRIWAGLLAALFAAAALAGGCEQSPAPGSVQDDEVLEDPLLEEPIFEPEPEPPKIAGVEIIEYPNLTFFAKNQPFSYEGLVLRFVMDNGEYGRNVESSEYTVKAVDTLTPRSDVVNITVRVSAEDAVHDEGYTADFVTYNVRYGIEIDSSTSVLSQIQLVNPPSKTSYKLGEKFSAGGLVIKGKYYDSETGNYSDWVQFEDAAVSVSGYDRRMRGTQQVKLKFNGALITTINVTVRVPAEASVTVNSIMGASYDQYTGTYRTTYIKGMGYDLAKSDLKAGVALNNETFMFTPGNGLSAGDVTGYNPSAEGGKQTLTVKLDEASATFEVYLADVEPHVYFDYGFMRTSIDPLGVMPGGGYTDSSRTVGRLAAAVNEKLVLAPVRFLIGYGEDNKDLGVTCTWSVSGPSTYTASYAGEFLYFSPTAAGDYDITVNVTGRGFVDGGTITRSATMRVACYQGSQPKPSGNTYTDPLRNYGCGQYSESGSGCGWSCGSALGYIVWNGGSGNIVGNQFDAWNEPGIVWVQGDGNGNGIPDEKWLEKTGSDDYQSSPYKSQVSRRYAIAYFLGSGDATINEYHQTIRDVYWVDGKGRNGRIPGGWPKKWGVPGHENSRVIYTGTILRDNGALGSGNYSAAGLSVNHFGEGYVDAGNGNYNGNWPNIYADGSSDGLPPASAVPLAGSQQLLSVSGGGGVNPSVSSAGLPALTGPLASSAYPHTFVKVQTAIFVYGSIYGDVSTEVKSGTGLPDQSDGFPDP
jgi:hypothetical protein